MSEEPEVYDSATYRETTKNMTPEERHAYREYLTGQGIKIPDHDGRGNNGQFVNGHKGGPGRPIGYRLRLASKVYQTIYEAFEAKGKDIVDRAMAGEDIKDAIAFMKMISSMLPKTVELESSSSSQQLLDYIAAQSSSNPIVKLKPEIADESE
jgi:hypothetical protein